MRWMPWMNPAVECWRSPRNAKMQMTLQGAQLATDVKASTRLSLETKAKLTREIIEYESTHGACTQTFSKKIRKQLR